MVSPLATIVVARSQRTADLGARIYGDKRDAYRAVASDTYKGRDLLAACTDELKLAADDAEARALIGDLEDAMNALQVAEPDTLAVFAVIAPDRVQNARDDFADAWNESLAPLWTLDRNGEGFTADAQKAVDHALDVLAAPTRRLRDSMRDDLCETELIK